MKKESRRKAAKKVLRGSRKVNPQNSRKEQAETIEKELHRQDSDRVHSEEKK